MKTKKKTAKKQPAATNRTMMTRRYDLGFIFMENPTCVRWIRAEVENDHVCIAARGSPSFDPDSLDEFIAHLQRLAKVVRKEVKK